MTDVSRKSAPRPAEQCVRRSRSVRIAYATLDRTLARTSASVHTIYNPLFRVRQHNFFCSKYASADLPARHSLKIVFHTIYVRAQLDDSSCRTHLPCATGSVYLRFSTYIIALLLYLFLLCLPPSLINSHLCVTRSVRANRSARSVLYTLNLTSADIVKNSGNARKLTFGLWSFRINLKREIVPRVSFFSCTVTKLLVIYNRPNFTDSQLTDSVDSFGFTRVVFLTLYARFSSGIDGEKRFEKVLLTINNFIHLEYF